jgi:hypothetical protein
MERQTPTYRGVCWEKNINKWKAQIKYDGKNRHLGCFEDEEEAAKAYDKVARAQHGETPQRFRMQLNFPTKKEHAAEEAKQQRWIKCAEAGSKYRGVCWQKSSSKWEAAIRHDRKKHNLGCFEDEEEAARAYDRAATAHKGEKAQLNFPAEGESGPRLSSKYRGVCWEKNNNKWKAQIKYDGKPHYLGCFEAEEEAAKAYDRAARAHQGEKAQPNFPVEDEHGSRKSSKYRGRRQEIRSGSSLCGTTASRR